jgi:hypothetical protein
VHHHQRSDPEPRAPHPDLRDESRIGLTGTLYVVACPIGNPRDLSPRAVETLRRADVVLAEDTRTARALLAAGVRLFGHLLQRRGDVVLLVDDDQTQVLPAHVGGKQAVRADHHVQLALRQRRHGRALVVRVAEARQGAHRHREVGEALREGDEVLLAQHRRGRENRDLLSVQHRQQRRP